jgi:hypothetical protein
MQSLIFGHYLGLELDRSHSVAAVVHEVLPWNYSEALMCSRLLQTVDS